MGPNRQFSNEFVARSLTPKYSIQLSNIPLTPTVHVTT